ncbi:MAG: TIGR02757 family protein [Balneolaceae bacterium]|nr:TIGR02757 family protein [Balneolaceae bacterium]
MKQIKPASPEHIKQLKPFLDEWVAKIETPEYIADDPVSFMHAFDDKEDQALAGFFAAIMAWGRRDIVLAKVQDLLQRMNHQPARFIRNFSDDKVSVFDGFKHRTFKPVDMFWLTKSLKQILAEHRSFEQFWTYCYQKARRLNRELITVFHHEFLGMHDKIPRRTHKHISNPDKGSAAKRLYMYLRWVIRNDSPVDPGIMNFMEPADLIIPLDVHAARQARVLGLLTRTYNDWKAAQELTRNMRQLDPGDPAKYDYALFGIGVKQEKIPDEFVLNPQFIK